MDWLNAGEAEEIARIATIVHVMVLMVFTIQPFLS
jgi:hypothetical protein